MYTKRKGCVDMACIKSFQPKPPKFLFESACLLDVQDFLLPFQKQSKVSWYIYLSKVFLFLFFYFFLCEIEKANFNTLKHTLYTILTILHKSARVKGETTRGNNIYIH